MYYIIVYDLKSIKKRKSPNILKILRKYLHWVQNSVFEGELSLGIFHSLLIELQTKIRTIDCIIIYQIENQNSVTKNILGIEKNSTNNFI